MSRGLRRPKVLRRAIADHYASPGQRIIEFSFPDGAGGLISFRQARGDAPNRIELYRVTNGTQVCACGQVLIETKGDPQ
jgi:hypothetical protein